MFSNFFATFSDNLEVQYEFVIKMVHYASNSKSRESPKCQLFALFFAPGFCPSSYGRQALTMISNSPRTQPIVSLRKIVVIKQKLIIDAVVDCVQAFLFDHKIHKTRNKRPCSEWPLRMIVPAESCEGTPKSIFLQNTYCRL